MSRGVADGAIRSDVDELATRSRRLWTRNMDRISIILYADLYNVGIAQRAVRGWTYGKKRHIVVDECTITCGTLGKIFEVAACAGTLGTNDERSVPSVDDFAVEDCILRRMKGDGKVALCSYDACKAHELREKGVNVHFVHVVVSFECEL